MRTKTAGAKSKAKRTSVRAPKTKPLPNGDSTPRTPTLATTSKTADRSAIKSPTAQPAELSESDRRRLRDWLDHSDRPFAVSTFPASRKRKRGAHQLQLQDDIFEDRLSVQYEVKPRDKWESLRRYKKFTVGSESIATGECILVKHDESDDPRVDLNSQWKAKVLEVRALDQEHVYIRLSWLNRPEDLDSGRKDYHGKNELIPTNQMDVIDAMAVNGALKVKHWDELADDVESSMPDEEEFFWRQTYDFANTKTFSALRTICVDEVPQNADELIVQCSNGECRKWMHVRCIAKKALERAIEDQAPHKRSSKAHKQKGKLKNPANNPYLTAVADASRNLTTAEVFIKDLPKRPNAEENEFVITAEETEIVITTESREQYSEELCCLFCGSQVD
ncbi:hypothetical protein Q7P37_001889 [Cladosporium fusiforme]